MVDRTNIAFVIGNMGNDRAHAVALSLADVIDDADHLVLKESAENPDDDMVEYKISASDQTVIVAALVQYASSLKSDA